MASFSLILISILETILQILVLIKFTLYYRLISQDRGPLTFVVFLQIQFILKLGQVFYPSQIIIRLRLNQLCNRFFKNLLQHFRTHSLIIQDLSKADFSLLKLILRLLYFINELLSSVLDMFFKVFNMLDPVCMILVTLQTLSTKKFFLFLAVKF